MELVVGREYRRADLHRFFGGQRQGGISTPASHPLILLFTGQSGEQYGYHDGIQPDGVFWYTGEGQVGDMQMLRGNAAIRDSPTSGRALHLFEQIRKGTVRYLGAASCLGSHETMGPDRDGVQRKVIVFELALDQGEAKGQPPDLHAPEPREAGALWRRSLDEVRAQALATAPKGASPTERRTVVRRRSEAVRVYVLRRANGTCEGCGQQAPFLTMAGHPYLEPHHIRRLADGGPDHPRWVAAVCPNCHRRVHHGKDGKTFNERLADRIGEREAH